MAIVAVISPIRESAITMPIGPMIRSAFLALTITGFSPVAPYEAPAFNMAEVAMLLVPIA